MEKLDTEFHLGVPKELRKKVWPVVVNNALVVDEELYESLLERAEELDLKDENNLDDPDIDAIKAFKKAQISIVKDLHRTHTKREGKE